MNRLTRSFVVVLIVALACMFVSQEQSYSANGPCDDCDILDLYIEMAPSDLELLYTRSPTSDDALPAVARLSPDGEALELRGIRFRGSSSRFLPKKSFNIRFEEPQDFLYGSSRMNLNAMYTDPSMMRESLSFRLFRHLGQPASLTRYFHLFINGSFEGLYIYIARVDGTLLMNSGIAAEGTLVRDKIRDHVPPSETERLSIFSYDIDEFDDPEAFLQQVFDSRGSPDWAALADLVRWVYQTPPGEGFAADFEQRIDLQNFVEWLAIHFLIADIDSFADDYWLFLPHNDPSARWMFIPWDKDLSFGSHFRPELGVANDFFSYDFPLESGWGNRLVEKFLQSASLRSVLESRLLEFVDQIFPEDWWREEIQRTGHLVEPSVHRGPGVDSFSMHPQNHHGELGLHPYHRGTLREFIALRYRFIRRQLEAMDGPPLFAQADLSEYGPGQDVYFTDSQGWTVARLRIHEVENPGLVTIQVSQELGLDGLDRVWSLDAGQAKVQGRLTLYYRNDVPWFLGHGNWYPEVEPVGRQWDLMISPYPLQTGVVYPSNVNPYANLVSAEIEFTGLKQLAVIHSPDKTGRRGLFAALLVSQNSASPVEAIETSVSISNVQAAPAGDFFKLLTQGGQKEGTIEFYLWNHDGELVVYETGAGSPGSGLDADGRLHPGETYTVFLRELLLEAGLAGDFVGYGWIVANFDGAQGTYVVVDAPAGFSRAFSLQPVMGKSNRYFGGVPILANDDAVTETGGN